MGYSRHGLAVAYQGGPGANGERAIAEYWKGAARAVSMRSFPALATSVADGTADYGVVPTWNSAIGDVREGCDALAAMGERIRQVDELAIRVDHALLGAPGASLETLRAVGSHAAAIAQCREFLTARADVTPIVAWDTAGAAMELAALAGIGGMRPDDAWVAPWYAALRDVRPESLGVIANRNVAASLGLVVLADGIQDDPDNTTRFAIVQQREVPWRW